MSHGIIVFCTVNSGKFSIVVTAENGTEKEVYQYDGEGSFGELALMYNMPRAATVKALTPGSLWALVTFVFVQQQNQFAFALLLTESTNISQNSFETSFHEAQRI